MTQLTDPQLIALRQIADLGGRVSCSGRIGQVTVAVLVVLGVMAWDDDSEQTETWWSARITGKGRKALTARAA
jgi:hypothetical protein